MLRVSDKCLSIAVVGAPCKRALFACDVPCTFPAYLCPTPALFVIYPYKKSSIAAAETASY